MKLKTVPSGSKLGDLPAMTGCLSALIRTFFGLIPMELERLIVEIVEGQSYTGE
jgi:hypothetical protein